MEKKILETTIDSMMREESKSQKIYSQINQRKTAKRNNKKNCFLAFFSVENRIPKSLKQFLPLNREMNEKELKATH